MAINPEYWRRARDEAPIHVQIRLDTKPARAGESKVAGPVVRIFRDRTGMLKIGDKLAFEVSCYVSGPPDPNPGPPMPGRQSVSLDIAWLQAARFLEAYLDFDPAKNTFHVAWEQATALWRKTDAPVNPAGGESPYGVQVTEEVLSRASRPKSLWSRFVR